MSLPCPCGSGLHYANCCEPYHAGLAAPTAETLMRSRYAAYVLRLDDYLHATWHPRTRSAQMPTNGAAVTWLKLEMLRSTAGGERDDQGWVEFKAHWQAAGRLGCLHEISRFEREQGRWYYLDGEIRPTPTTLKTGRNDPCPCGSGKKFKRCCGA